MPEWTKAEVKKLKKIYATSKDLKAAFPGRSIKSIRTKAGSLGLKRTVIPPGNWTEEQTNCAVNMFREGKSFNAIAVILGKTKGAVAGRLDRLGIKRDNVKDSNTAQKRRREPPMNLVAFEEKHKGVNLIRLVEAGHFHCKWISGEVTSDPFCCGKRVIKGSYCEKHARIAYRKQQGKPLEFLKGGKP